MLSGPLLEETVLVLPVETLGVGTRWLLTAPWKNDVCQSAALAACSLSFAPFTSDFCVALTTDDLLFVL